MNKESEERPWGRFERFTHNELSTVKIITIKPNEELSLQYHHKRREFWRILKGHPFVIIGDKNVQANPGEEFSVPEEVPHRLRASDEEVELLEIAFGVFDESDIVRLEDRYGRT